MKRLVSSFIAFVATSIALWGCFDKPPPPAPPTPTAQPAPIEPATPPRPPPLTPEEREKALYAFGVTLVHVGTPLGQMALSESDVNELVKGLTDAFDRKEPAVSLEKGTPLSERLVKQRTEERSAAEKKKGAAFVAAALKEKGAQQLPSGMVIVTAVPGEGISPRATDRVEVNYRATLINGTEFDSSKKRGGGPVEFSLARAIQCWREGLQKMKAGGRALLICPAELGYGEKGSGRKIVPNATLIFEVELLSIK